MSERGSTGRVHGGQSGAGMILVQHSLFLQNFAVQASIGVHGHERAAPQRLLISVRLKLDQALSPHEDDLSEVVDYDFLRDGIQRIIADRHYDLQETLVNEILQMCAGRPKIIGAVVSTRKPDVYPDCDSVGYEAEVTFR